MVMEMRGSLNLSKYYTKSNQPKYYSKALINGVEYTLKGWEKVRQDTGEVWVSLMFEDPAEAGAREFEQMAKPNAYPSKPLNPVRPVRQTYVENEDIDDIPF